MDRGAHFFRCDFQVHSPRDCNWVGGRPTDDDKRLDYAKKFIAACRHKGLDAVAITDHHDLCFFPYIKAAAAAEADEHGFLIPDHSRIVVFPGMELTLAVPCQALLIFDADIPVDCLQTVCTVLGVTQNGHEQPTHVQPTRLDIGSLETLHEMLDRIEILRGRYIVLPNVSEGGNSTILRSGFAPKYRSMPCVGGYVDGAVSQLGRGNKEILDGNNRDYGCRKIGVLQTSDNRNENFDDLGKHSTWVKWATPTAEAIRQACLAQQTRISHQQPVMPGMVITKLEVSNSKFLGPIDIDFNPQFNCLIGGRGTGKSTILEYIRWGLCDQPPNYSDEDEGIAYQSRRANLIDRTLIPFDGVVTVSFTLDSVPHVVRRSSLTKEVSLKIGSNDFKPCAEADVRDLLSLQAYSQKQLSAVGVRTDEVARFIRTSIKAELDRLGSEIDAQKAHIRDVFSSVVRKRQIQRELDRDELELDSLVQRVDALRHELGGVSEEDKQVLTSHDLYLLEEQFVEKLGRELESVREMATDFSKSLSELPSKLPAGENLPNSRLIEQIRFALVTKVNSAQEQITSIVSLLENSDSGITIYLDSVAKWRDAFRKHNELYQRAMLDASSHQSQITQIDDAEAKIKVLRTAVAEKQAALALFAEIEDSFSKARSLWVGMFRSRATMMQTKCNELTALSEDRIRASLRAGAGVARIKDRLLSLVVGTKIRTKKVEDLCDLVSTANDPFETWTQVVLEFEKLVDYSGSAGVEPKPRHTPLLAAQGFTANDLDRLAPRLTPEEWIELSLTELEDIPVFEYRQSIGQYIQFADASAGQQATALLRVLLNQSGPPLIIDQPEEDLDNQVILDVVQLIWKAKSLRQIVFSSHIPNTVVIGDADLVVCCDYRIAGDHSGGQIKCCGAIDVDEIKREITVVMEGGKDAFRLRKEKYGF